MGSVEELIGTWSKSKRILMGYVITFLWPTLESVQVFNEDFASSASHVISVFKFSPHICKRSGCNCSTSHPPGQFRSSGGQCWNASSVLYVSTEELSAVITPGAASAGLDVLEKRSFSLLPGIYSRFLGRPAQRTITIRNLRFCSCASWTACSWRWRH